MIKPKFFDDQNNELEPKMYFSNERIKPDTHLSIHSIIQTFKKIILHTLVGLK
jgi:hypothetical protein